jgi:hypothetical protein
MVSDRDDSARFCSATPALACNGQQKNFIMFFAAERELQQKRRRETEELVGKLSVCDDASVHVGPYETPRSPLKALDAVYPTFSSTRIDDVVRIATEMDRPVPQPPQKRRRGLDSSMGANSASSPEHDNEKSLKRVLKPQSFDDLVNLFPQLEGILQQQQRKMHEIRIADEYIREIEKPKQTVPLPALESQKDQSTIWQPSFAAVDAPKPKEPPPLPTGISNVAPAQTGGGLLSGIDDLFGSPKKKTRSKRR